MQIVKLIKKIGDRYNSRHDNLQIIPKIDELKEYRLSLTELVKTCPDPSPICNVYIFARKYKSTQKYC